MSNGVNNTNTAEGPGSASYAPNLSDGFTDIADVILTAAAAVDRLPAAARR